MTTPSRHREYPLFTQSTPMRLPLRFRPMYLAALGSMFGLFYAHGTPAITSFHTFPLAPSNPIGPLVLASDHNLYGVSQAGGTNNLGTIFKVTPAGAVSTVASFTGTAGALPGAAPSAALVVGQDGNLYGTTIVGGSANLGVVFKFVPGGSVTVLGSFTGTDGLLPGSDPSAALVVLPDGDIFGTTSVGGTSGDGTIFKITSVGVVSSVASFTGISGGLPGQTPCGCLTVGPDGNIYGVTQLGGNGGLSNSPGKNGTIFQVTPAGTATCVVQFGDNEAPYGQRPVTGLTVGPDGNLYGVTPSGGAQEYGSGVVFKLTTSGQITTLAQFDSTISGMTPQGPLTLAQDGNLYGTTSQDGNVSFPAGTIFKVVPGGAVTSIYTFQAYVEPTGPMVVGADGNLYGTYADYPENDEAYYYGGTQSIFEFATGGSTTLLGTTSGLVSQSLVAGGDGNLYGVCNKGGTGGLGIGLSTLGSIFKVPPGGPVTSVDQINNPEGIAPNNFTKGPDGNLYGFVSNGTNQDLVQISPAGTITARATVPGISDQEGGPFPSPLLLGSDGNLWGTLSYIYDPTYGWNTSSVGDVIKVVSTGIGNLSITIVNQLPGQPGGLTLGKDGNIYGLVFSTGETYVIQNGVGSYVTGPPGVYQVTPAGNYTLEGTLDGSPTGPDPSSLSAGVPLTVGSDGNLYGMTSNGGANVKGSIFQVVHGVGITTVASFGSATSALSGSTPNGSLVAAGDGNLYGTTPGAPVYYPTPGGITINLSLPGSLGSGNVSPAVDTGSGTIFRYTPGGSAMTIAAFTGGAGSLPGQNPTGHLIVGSNGSLYDVAGTTASGGLYGSGPPEVYKVALNGTATVLGLLPPGSSVVSPLFLAGDGAIYAAASNEDFGFIFRIDPDDSLTIPFNLPGDGGGGAYPISALFPDDATHFYGLSGQGSGGTIYSVNTSLPFSQTVLFPAVADQTYGGTLTIASASSLLPVTYTATGPIQLSGNVATFTGVGPVTVTASQPGNGMFTAATSVTQSFNVDPAVLTYNAKSVFRGLGLSNPVLSGTVSGFVNGETQGSATTGTLTFSTSATVSSPVGWYPIAGGGLSAVNYIFNQNTNNAHTLDIVSALTFAQWESAYGIYSYGNQTPQNDGVPFLLKYLLDIDPTGPISNAEHSSLPSMGVAPSSTHGMSDLTLTYRRNALANNVTVNVQTSTDLQNWTTVPANQLDINQVLSTDPSTGDSMVEVGTPITGSPQFIRLNVTSP